MRMKKATFRHIESELENYAETKKEFEQLKLDCIFSSPTNENVGSQKGNIPSDPTSNIVLEIISNRRMDSMEKIIKAIEHVYNNSNNEKKKLIQLRYWQKPTLYTWEGIALKLNISRITAIRWRTETIYQIGERLGWR